MALDEKDPSVLRRNVLQLLLQHSEGVSFGNFTGAFYQLHGYHPDISRNGYRSLQHLVADMKNVVVEGDSHKAVMKIANGFHHDYWLEGGEKNGLDSSEGEAQSLTEKEKAGSGTDVSATSTSDSAQDLVKEPAIQATDLLVALPPIWAVLECHPNGMKVKKLEEGLRKQHEFDLETFRRNRGYKDVISFLQNIPGLRLQNSNKTRNCIVQLQTRPCSPALSLDTDFSECISNILPQGLTRKKSDLASGLVPILEVLGGHPHGLNVKALKENLEKKHRFDLETLSQDLGYEDVVACLLHMPGLSVSFINGKWPLSCVVQLLSDSLGTTSELPNAGPSLDKPLSSSGSSVSSYDLTKTKIASHSSLPSQFSASPSLHSAQSTSKSKTLDQTTVEKKPASCSSASSQVSTSPSLGSGKLDSKLKKQKENILGKTPASCSSASASASLGSGQLGSKPKKQKENILGKTPVVSEVLALVTGLLSMYNHGLRVKKVKELLLATERIDLEQFSIAQGHKDTLEFLEHRMPMLNIKYRENRPNCVVFLGSASCSSASASPSLGSGQLDSKPKKQKENILGKTPVVSEVLALVTGLLNVYKHGLRVKKVKELLLATERIDLEQFSISQGHKDTLEFLEHRMPMLNIKYRENRPNCVVFLGSGPGVISTPPLSGPVQFLGPSRRAEPVSVAPGFGDVPTPSFTFGDFSASKPQIQSCPVAAGLVSPPVENCLHTSKDIELFMISDFPSLREPQSASVDNNTCLSVSGIPPKWPSVCRSGGLLPVKEVPNPLDAQRPSESSLTKPHPPKDLNELKQQVGQILAMHPKGMSLFQFRAAYSATYQLHLPLGSASSAKQRLLEMPDVVCLKGYGVQTLLLPVSYQMSPAKSGQPVFSKVENAAMLPGPPLHRTVAMAEPGAVLKPSLPKVPVVPQPHPVCVRDSDQPRELGGEDCSLFPENQSLRAPKIAAPGEGQRTAGINCLGQAALPKVKEATVVPVHSLPDANLAMAPKYCLKCLPHKLPVPQPLQSSECLQASIYKADHLFPQPQLQKTPRPIVSAVICPQNFQATRWGENEKPTYNGALAPLPVADNSAVCVHPVMYPPVISFLEIPKIPPLCSASVLPVSGNTSRIQFQKTVLQSSHCAQPVRPVKLVQPMSPIQMTNQRNCVHMVPIPDLFYQGQKLSRSLQSAQSPVPVFSVGTLPVSSPSRKSASICLQKSQTVHQPECENPTQLGDLQHISASVPEKSSTFTPLNRNPSKLPVSTYEEQYDDVNSPLPSPGTQSFNSQSAPTNASPQPVNASSSINSSSDVLLSDHSVSMHQQQCTSESTVVPSLSTRPVCSPHYPLDSTISPSCQLPCAPSGISNNSDELPTDPSIFMPQQQYTTESAAVTTSSTRLANSLLSPLDTTTSSSHQPSSTSNVYSNSGGLPSEPLAFMHQQQCASSVSTAMNLRTKPANSPPSLQDSIANPRDQPSSASLSVSTDYDAPSQAHPVSMISKPSDNSYVSLSEKQMPYSAPESNHLATSSDRCVIL